MTPNVLLILGGGCAGLSLAMRLADGPMPYDKLIMIEKRDVYRNDRTWCFWKLDDAHFSQLAACEWRAFRIADGQSETIVDCAATPYQMIRSGDFYEFALTAIKRSPKIELHLGHAIKNIVKTSQDGWVIETDRGSFSGSVVIDTRPDAPEDTRPILWQSFFGQEIICEAGVFEAAVPDLMNFLPTHDDGVAFSYILPFSETEGLLETTVFGPDILTIDDLAERQNRLVSRITKGRRFDVRRSEYGALPMGAVRTQIGADSHFKVGIMAGSLRPSTGYAFQRIQRWAEACAISIRKGSGPIGHAPDPWPIRMMDDLFLKVMRGAPQLGAKLFCRIFKNVRPDKVIRFLSDHGKLDDCLAVIFALPSYPFLRILGKSVTDLIKGARI
ncbi:MAG: lycopene cyclase family protein [Hyphomicrobiales bacterium]